MRIIIVLLVLVLLTHPVLSSAGVRGPALALREFDFEPNKVIEVSFYIYGSESLDLLLTGGALVEHAQIVDPNPRGGPRSVTVTLTLPDKLEPGEHKLYVGALEQMPDGQVGGRAGAMMSIRVRVLADYPSIKHELSVANAALGDESTTATLSVESWTTQDLQIVADINVYNNTGGKIRTLRTPKVDLDSKGTKSLAVDIPTAKLPRGYYKADAHIYYANNMTVAEDGFLIGDVDLTLLDYTKTLTRGKINKLSFQVRSDWNQPMHNVNAELTIGDETARSPSVKILPFMESNMELFVDTESLDSGEHNATLTVFFENRQKNFPITLKVIDEQTPAALQAQQVKTNLSIPINSMTILYFLVALLVLVNIYLVFRKSGKKE